MINQEQAAELKRLECIVVSCAASRNIETTRKARQKLRSCIDSLVVESFADVERTNQGAEMTPEQAAELKRLIVQMRYIDVKDTLFDYIGSLTQPAPELTDGELGDAIFSAVASMPMNLAAYPSRLYVARAVIAADRAKQGGTT